MAQGSKCAEEERVPEKPHPSAPAVLPFSTCPRDFLKETKPIVELLFGDMEGEGGFSYKLFFHNQVFKNQQSQRMRRNKHHTIFGTQTSRQRQAARQTHTQAGGPPTATHTLVSLLYSQPWSTRGLEAAGNPATTPKPHPGSQATDVGKEGSRGETLHILVSLADSCSSLV